MSNPWIAEYNSTNFDFRAFGATESESIKNLKKGLEKHAMQYGLSLDWYCNEGIQTVEVIPGKIFRDSEEIRP